MCYVTLDQMTIRQLTAIDTVTYLVELVRIDDKTSDNVSRKYAQCWLARYLWPQQCIHDPGGELRNSKHYWKNVTLKMLVLAREEVAAKLATHGQFVLTNYGRMALLC